MALCCCTSSTLSIPPASLPLNNSTTRLLLPNFQFPSKRFVKLCPTKFISTSRGRGFGRCTRFCTGTMLSETESEYETEDYDSSEEDYLQIGDDKVYGQPSPPVRRRLRRYRKEYPGERKGISEEMRFVAMKLRNNKKDSSSTVDEEVVPEEDKTEDPSSTNQETWQPSVEGFLKYLVDNQLIFTTIERIVDESSHVSYAYFRKTGLERSASISKDLQWFREMDNVIPDPSPPGVQYARYLEELAKTTPPLFLAHFYNIYFSHIAGGQVIAKQVSDKLFNGRELEFNAWEGDAQELLRDVREKLNALGEHWSRDEKNKCLREATKAFRFLGQILRLIVQL